MGLECLSYETWLKYLGFFFSFEKMWLKGDIMEVYKVIKGTDSIRINVHQIKLTSNRFKIDKRKYYFIQLVADLCKSLA